MSLIQRKVTKEYDAWEELNSLQQSMYKQIVELQKDPEKFKNFIILNNRSYGKTFLAKAFLDAIITT